MRLRILSAFVLSLILIVGATLLKPSSTNSPDPKVVSIDKDTSNSLKTNSELDIANLEASTDNQSKEKLTTTDLVGRQFMADYLSLAQAGEITDKSLELLTDKYVDNLPTISQSRKITYLDISTASDNKQTFQEYKNAITKINQEYESEIARVYTSNSNADDYDNFIYSMSKYIGSAYENAATKLSRIKVPTSLVEVHIKLVNAYFKSSESMSSLSLADTDPVVALVGAISIKTNINTEDSILLEISEIMRKYDL